MTKLLNLALLMMATSALAQTAPVVELTWQASASSTAADPGTVQVYRAPGACPATGLPQNYTVIDGSAPAGGPYMDAASAGTYCYFLTATIDGVASGPSTLLEMVVPGIPQPPAKFSGSLVYPTKPTVGVTAPSKPLPLKREPR